MVASQSRSPTRLACTASTTGATMHRLILRQLACSDRSPDSFRRRGTCRRAIHDSSADERKRWPDAALHRRSMTTRCINCWIVRYRYSMQCQRQPTQGDNTQLYCLRRQHRLSQLLPPANFATYSQTGMGKLATIRQSILLRRPRCQAGRDKQFDVTATTNTE